MDAGTAPPSVVAALHLDRVRLERGGRWILDDITWTVKPNERWLVLGANGSGKTSLLRIAALYEHPTRGRVQVLGQTLGAVDVRVLRRRIGFASPALASQLRPDLAAIDVVMTAKHAALEPWWHTYHDDDRQRAADCLTRMGVGELAERRLGSLSSGEQQRVLLARILMAHPALVLLDEPGSRLDLAGREHLVAALAELAADPTSPAMVLVTNHVDEVPPGITHVLLLRRGRVLAAGPLAATLSSDSVSACFELPLRLEQRDDGRFSAFALRPLSSRA